MDALERQRREQELRQRAEALVGKVLREKWRLDALIGLGGMAAVYAATHRNGKRAAVKVLHPEAALAPSVKERFLREGYVANKVGHGGAVSILDDDIDADGTVFLVMELLHGETLDARVSRLGARLEAPEVLQITDQVLDCLASAHDKGIVHRDLKPGNLFVTEDGITKILDFGIAHLEDASYVPVGGTGSQTLGTPGFMPPEQARGRFSEVDAKSDLWAMGAVMYALLSGRQVHEAATANEQLLQAMTVPAERLGSVTAGSHEAVVGIVDKALRFAKEERWADARTMQAAVKDAYASVAGVPITQAPKLSGRIGVGPLTAAAATMDEGAQRPSSIGQTTARPVMKTGAGKPVPQSKRRGGPVVLAAGGAVLAAVAFVLLRHPAESVTAPEDKKAAQPASASSSQGPALVGTAKPSESADAKDAPASSAAAGGSEAKAPSQPAAKALVQAGPKKAARAKGTAAPATTTDEVDLFSRRR